MKTLPGTLAGVLSLVVALTLAWRIVVTGLADRWAEAAPERTLALEPDSSIALRILADQQLKQDDLEAAAATAKHLLAIQPLAGTAFVTLARIAEKSGDVEKTAELYRIAVRRAPRDSYSRAWLIEYLLDKGAYAEALGEYDILYKVSPGQGAKFFPLFSELSGLPDFADVLTGKLQASPSWTAGLLAELLDHGRHDALDRVFGALHAAHALSREQAGRWFERLMRDGLWGEAYSRWAGSLALAPGAPVPLLYNGGFETEPTGIGFDWRIRPATGVIVERAVVGGSVGRFAVSVSFSGRRVPEVNFEQRLFLAPGDYTLSFRAQATALRSDRGLQWAIQCQGPGQGEPLAVSEALDGSFGWRRLQTPFVVPGDGCVAQRIWLRNPGAAAAGKGVSGDVWFDDFAITPEVRSN